MITESTKLTVVGDDLQCIYNWRGSDVLRIIHFTNDFPNSQLKYLKQNYRSNGEIVNAANAIANRISIKASNKELIPTRINEAGKRVYWLLAEDEIIQSKFIASIVTRCITKGIN